MARKTGSHAEITGPKMREAALRLFARHGYAAVSMRKIAAEVGVQAGALYLYTPDKQSLLFDLMKGHMDDLLAAWHRQEIAADPAKALEQFARFHIAYHIGRPDAVFVAYMELRNLEPDNFAVVEDLRRRYESLLEEIIARGIKSNVFRPQDTKLATLAVIAMLTGVSTWYRSDGRMSPTEVEDIYVEMALGAVGNAPKP